METLHTEMLSHFSQLGSDKMRDYFHRTKGKFLKLLSQKAASDI